MFAGSLEDNTYALTDEEYKFSLGKDYIFFEITEPEQLAYTYKVSDMRSNMYKMYNFIISRPTPRYSPRPGTSATAGSPWCPPR